ncbi:hypothetical protein HYC85_017868 [Camellia sinensis]|uniref:UBC core domain-containing protein n=1 Tax=Camellia sinensis TaxID=4442 RepID=A0A7J7GV10_CAMSI|nr:hypothetical protein HYC85_017868 [Camellia sinensis]
MSFPSNYPNSPPTVKFISKIWHPNDGFALSILLSSWWEPNGYELVSERWSPVESIVLSIISILSSPNDESPANIEGTVSVFWLYSYFLFLTKVKFEYFQKSQKITQKVKKLTLFTKIWLTNAN